jgi:hypothetical protein
MVMDVWECLQNGRFVDACDAADKEFADSSSILPLRNKVYALLSLSRFDETIELCNRIITLTHGSTDSDFIMLGVAKWILRQPQEAIETWSGAKNTKYTDAAGGIEIYLLLFFASIIRGDDAMRDRIAKKLRQLCRRGEIGNWPAPIAAFLLRDLTEDQLLELVARQGSLRAKQLCQALFYIGVLKLAAGDRLGFMDCMRNCCEHGSSVLTKQEYYLARAYVTNLLHV